MSVRVLQVVSHLGHRGADQQVRFLALGLPRDQFDVHVCAGGCCTHQRQSLEQMDIPVAILGGGSKTTRYGAGSWKSPTHFWRLIAHISRLAPQLVHVWPSADEMVETRFAQMASFFARGVRRSESPQLVFGRWSWESSREGTTHRAINPSLAAVDRLLDRFTARITRPSLAFDAPNTQGNTRGSPNVIPTASSGKHHFALPMGVRGMPCASRTPRCEFFRAAHLPSNTKLIVTYSDYTASSRFKDAIWTADLLKVIRDDTHLVIIGDGPSRWRGERFRDQVKIWDRVHFVTDCCQWERWIPYAHCFWDVDGEGNTLAFAATAMANGIPVVAADTPSSRGLLGNDGARYFSVGHRGGLARHCQELLENEESGTSLAAVGRERTNRWLSVEQMVRCYADFYRELAGT